MKKTYLINPPSPFLLDDRSNIPLGLLYVHAFLKSKNQDVVIIDLAGKMETEWDIPDDADIYGISSTTPQFSIALKIAERIKRKQNLVVLGGVHGTCVPENSLLDSKFDAVVIGDGEYAMSELVNNGDLSTIKGITYWKNGKAIHNESRPVENNVDVFSHPLLEALDFKTYHCGVFTTVAGDHVSGTQLITSRGCPYNCAFCSSPYIYKRRIRFHTAEYMEKWIYYLRGKGFNHYYIVDDTLLLQDSRLKRICSILKKHNSLWRCCARGDAATRERLKLMYDSGCRQIDLGVESGSQKILDAMQKDEKVEDNGRAIRLAHEIGIKIKACIMVGLPGEEQKDVDLTIDFLKMYEPDSVTLCTFIPFPGSRIFQEPDKFNYKIDPHVGYDRYFCCGAETNTYQARSVSTLNEKGKSMEFREQLLKVIENKSTLSTLKKRYGMKNI